MLKVMKSHQFTIGLLLLLTSSLYGHAAKSSPSFEATTMVMQQQSEGGHSRHLQFYNGDRNDEDDDRSGEVECPTNSVYHCNEPNRYVIIDPTVACDPETCLWDLSLLSPFRQPYICRGVAVDPDTRVFDMLEPCLWWQTLFGEDENGDRPSRNTPPLDVDDPQAEPREQPPAAPAPPLPGDDDPYEPTSAPSLDLEDENTEPSNGTTTIFDPSLNSTFNSINSTNSSESMMEDDMLDFAPEANFTNTTTPWDKESSSEKGDWFATSSSEDDNGDEPSSTTTLNFNTILITYFVTTNMDQEDRRRVLLLNNNNKDVQQSTSPALRRGSSSSSSSLSSRLLKSVWKDVDREQLLDLTMVHLLSFIPEAKSVIITLTVLQEESETTGSIVAATEALKGSVVFDTAAMKNISLLLNDYTNDTSVALDRRVKSAFQDEEALKEYMSSIQASSDPILKRTVQVTLGLPRDPSTSGAGFSRVQGGEDGSVGGDDETSSSLTDFEWNPLWIAILVGAAIGVLGLCTVGTYLFWARRLHRRRLESGVVKATLTGSFTYGGHADDDDNNNSPHSANLGASPSGVVVLSRGGRRGFPSDRNSGGGSGRGRPSSPQSFASSSVSRRDSRLLLADVTGDSEDAMLADLQSECTSVYSYLEKSTVAGAESITTMQIMAMMDDDASITTPCPGTSSYYRPNGSTTPDTTDKKGPSINNNRMDLSSMWSVMDGLDAPAAMVIQDNTTDEESGEIEEFHDEEEVEEKKSESFDEDINVRPHGNGGKKKIIPASNTKLMFSAEKDKSGQNNGIYIFDDDVSVVSEKSTTSKISQPREDPKIVDTAGRHESPSNPNASSIKVVGKADVDLENGTDGDAEACRLAFCDLSQVAEGSECSSRVSCSSEMSGGKLERKLSMDKENAVGKLLDDSEIQSDGEDDDDSLFMRPTLGLKATEGASPSAGQTVLLSNENKVSPSKDAFRMVGPIARGGDKLTPNEKKHMFIMERTPGGSFDDSSLHSIRLPGNLNSPEYSRDDMSLSTTGSTNGKALKLMASF